MHIDRILADCRFNAHGHHVRQHSGKPRLNGVLQTWKKAYQSYQTPNLEEAATVQP